LHHHDVINIPTGCLTERGQKVAVTVLPAGGVSGPGGTPGWLTDGNENNIGDFTAGTGYACINRPGCNLGLFWPQMGAKFLPFCTVLVDKEAI
jgi:hypothetical protein